jgi:hypothetical protein
VPAKITLHPPQRASRFLLLREGESVLVGRDPECTLVIEDPRVSKRHARVAWREGGWALEDLASKNGTTVNGLPATGAPLADGDWVSLGGILGRFERVSEQAAQALQSERLGRLQTSIEMRRRLGAALEPLDFLLRFLQATVELVGAHRGFVLLGGHDGVLRAEVACGFGTGDLEAERFAGSRGAVQRVLETRAPVVVADAQSDPYLGRRASVIGMRLGALACIPIFQDERMLGLLYVDGPDRAAGFTELDLEILQSMAEHAALAIGALRLQRRMNDLVRTPLAGPDTGVLQALQRQLGAEPGLTLATP